MNDVSYASRMLESEKSLYEQRMKLAVELREAKKLLNQVIKEDIYEHCNQIYEYWTGTGARSYIRLGELIREDISAIARWLEDCAESLEEMATNEYNAEKAAAELVFSKYA